ncbi:hypothetical protein JL722_11406 [Aureococcus anophagefferens]|nr:hypothetical protein JL722_11406 [Aureococcus anophagefferens]
MDAVPGDVAALLPPKCCYSPTPRSAASASVAPSPLKTPARKRASTRLEITTVAARFRASLAELSRDVDATTPHFIRCLKPNDDNGADALDRPRLVEQLRYCGVLEAVRVARAGYAVRLPHGAFVAAYKCLGGPRFSPAAAVDDGPSLFEDDAGEGDSFAAVERHRDDAEALVAALLAADLDLGKGSLALGASKVFLRHACFDALEAALAARRAAAAVRVAAFSRARAARRSFVERRTAAVLVAARVRGVVAFRRFRRKAIERKSGAATVFQKHVRRRSASLSAAKFRLTKLAADEATVTLKATRLQAAYRACVPRRFVLAAAPTTVSVEAFAAAVAGGFAAPPCRTERDGQARGPRASRGARRARDATLRTCPSARDLAAAWEGKRAALDAALEQRDFATCSKLEPEVARLKALCDAHPEPLDDGASRDAVVEKIAATRSSLEEARRPRLRRLRRARGGAGDLEKQLEELDADPEPMIVAARAARAAAVAAADWRSAGAAQADAAKWEKKADRRRKRSNSFPKPPENSADAAPPRPRVVSADARAGPQRAAALAGLGRRRRWRRGIRRGAAPPVAAAVAKQKRVVAAPAAPRPITGGKTVEKLRPEAPVVLEASAPLAAVCDAMAAKRTDCALLTDSDGGLAGIVTDNDVARKAVAAGLDCDATPASAVMTARPTCVRSGDAALEALRLMVSNHFRHLPVLGESGAIVGVLNMQKCLYEAITKIETLERLAGDGGDAGLAEAMIAQLAKAGGSKKHLAKLVGPLMESLAGSTAKTLRAVLEDGRTDCLLDAEFYFVSDAAATIAATRRAVLATADGGLAGILTPKDVLNRVVAKRLDPAATPLAAVMTPNPDTISLDATLLEALHMMHDNKYLHLPVVDGDAVVGVVDVMEVVYATMGDGDDEGWSTLMSEDFGDDASDRGSLAKTSTSVPSASGGRSVEKLRPEAPVVLEASTVISDVCKAMAAKRTDCALLTSAVGTLAGIVTDNDVARKAVARGSTSRRRPWSAS